MTFNFNIFHCFSNIRDHLAILAIWSACLVKFLSVDGFICQLKTENSRCVADSRPVCVGLYTFENLTLQNSKGFLSFLKRTIGVLARFTIQRFTN
jgi:hypothetical protein